jgi:anti-sigma-K factor RskA
MAEAHREEHLDRCAELALGNLDDIHRAGLEAHLATGCPTCEAAIQEMSRAVTVLAATAPAIDPPPGLRDRVLSAARASGEDRARARVVPSAAARRRSIEWWTGWVAAAACLALAIWSGQTAQRLRHEIAAQKVQISTLERERTDLEERLASEQRWVSVVTAADARIAVLAPTPQGDPALRGRAIVDPAGERVAVTFSNLRPPAGRAYELWAIRDGKPRSLGLLRPDANGDARLQIGIEDPTEIGAFAVSLEPETGAPTPDAPTGPVVLVGTFGG